MLYYNSQNINKKDAESVINSLYNRNITQGPSVHLFEKKISRYLKSKFTTVLNSGTSALYIAIKSLGLKKQSIVVMPSVNFIASYNMCKLLDLKIYLADVDPVSGQMTPENFNMCLKKYKIRKIDLLINLHMSGHPNYVKEFYEIKKKFKCFLIEDACHAFGSSYKIGNKSFKIGSCKHSDICTFSFHAIKSITTGEGGAITTKNKKFYNTFLLLRSHGIKKNNKCYWKYDVSESSFNFRLSDINCALGISQLRRVNIFVKKRTDLARGYCNNLIDFNKNVSVNLNLKNIKSSWHLFKIYIDFKSIKSSREKFIQYMKKNKIITQHHYIPIYKFSLFRDKVKLPGAEKHFSNNISLPLHYNMKISDVIRVIKLTKEFVNKKL